MNRREFLQSTFGACSTILLGENFLSTCSAMAGEKEAKLLNIRSGFENLTTSNQNYFWLEFMLSSECEIIQSQTSDEFVFLVKKCRPSELVKSMNYTNPYIKRVEVRESNQQDFWIVLSVKDPTVVTELRYALIPSVLHTGRYCLRIDVGSFSSSTAMKEKALGIEETNLAFKYLETRAFTDLIVIHHAGLGDVDTSAERIHQLHLGNGWSGIGYHYVIHKNGRIERGRPRETVGAHTYKYNKSSVGILIDGDFEISMPTDVQIEKAAMLIAALSHIYNISPDNAHLLGHRDLISTLCPGKNLYVQLPKLRDKAISYL